ncbi:MAG: hypothetical protein QW502_01335 [Candidatus Bathyarchaeia archaeon]
MTFHLILEEYAMPGQRINVVVVKDNQPITIDVELGSRPPG